MIRYSWTAALLIGAMWTLPAYAVSDKRDVVRNSYGHVVVNSFNNCVRTQWVGDKDACEPQQPMRKRAQLSQEERTIYFGFNKATLSPQAANRLDSLASALKADSEVKQAQIVGYADRIGTPSYNEKLSKRRAEAVRRYLISRGFINATVADTRWLGESAPVTQCPDTLSRPQLIECLQRDRRVEVEIDYLPEGQVRK